QQSELDRKRGEPEQPRPDTPDPAKEAPPQPSEPSEEPRMEIAAIEEALHNPPLPTPTPPSPEVKALPPVPQMITAPDDSNVKGANEYVPPTRKVAQVEITDQAYGALLMKKVRDNLVYPDDAKRARLQGVTTVSFVILSNGDVSAETLKVVKSSGYPAL